METKVIVANEKFKQYNQKRFKQVLEKKVVHGFIMYSKRTIELPSESCRFCYTKCYGTFCPTCGTTWHRKDEKQYMRIKNKKNKFKLLYY